jgi:hypothetical protein
LNGFLAKPRAKLTIGDSSVKNCRFVWITLFGLCAFHFAVFAEERGTPEQEAVWRQVVALDAGPEAVPVSTAKSHPPSPSKVSDRFANHLLAQEEALRRFLLTKPAVHFFEANFRLARVLALRAELESNATLQEQADAVLESLEKGADLQQQAHIAFERISQWMRRNRLPSKEQRTELLAAAQEFRDRFPSDPRVARLLVEVATQFDREPERKRTLLEEAQKLTREAALRRRIEDDFRKLGLLGKTLQLKCSDVGGRTINLEQMRGKPLVLLYVSGNSQVSLLGWKTVNDVLRAWPEVQRVCISIDVERALMEGGRKEYGEGWSVSWDGLGWSSPLARRWGINAVPTCWLLDSRGRLISLNALDGLAGQLEALKESER